MEKIFKALYTELQCHANPQKAEEMKAYMKHQFEFLGISAPERRMISKPFLAEMKKEKNVSWEFAELCWEAPHREMQYIAADYLNMMKKYMSPDDIPNLTKLIVKKAWWDSVDYFHSVLGEISLKFPEANEILLILSKNDNFWLRRVVINHQILRREKTNVFLMEKIIENNFGQTNFFINKAIGWALRDFSKTNPVWVKSFIQKHEKQMAKLSIREASKYL